MVTDLGGSGVAVPCDHKRDEDVEAVFATIQRDTGRLDVLVNNATGLPDLPLLFSNRPFWEVSVPIWDDLFNVGLRSHFVAARLAAPMMVSKGRGLIVNISSAGAQARVGLLPYGVAKAALDRMTADMAEDLKPYGVTVLSLWPPPSSTERMLASVEEGDDPSKWSTPIFTGRVIAALAARPGVRPETGKALRVRELAQQLQVEDRSASC
jgi:dehydrogenase/reductase SDR family member 1